MCGGGLLASHDHLERVGGGWVRGSCVLHMNAWSRWGMCVCGASKGSLHVGSFFRAGGASRAGGYMASACMPRILHVHCSYLSSQATMLPDSRVPHPRIREAGTPPHACQCVYVSPPSPQTPLLLLVLVDSSSRFMNPPRPLPLPLPPPRPPPRSRVVVNIGTPTPLSRPRLLPSSQAPTRCPRSSSMA